ncbi:MAG: ADP-glyceromanno-heptose 6-epimerase [Chlamydiae bacterium RIFCSPHIGHO2_12_FULL_27_8]|nr:MAG: ADP-glyceromanno-heptose 6-epimerase [Chlamydiae bacterium RIFCSPHIGHO2_12_FULL_27_8]
MKRNKIVVTGAAGFIGSALVKYLNEQNIKNIFIVDDLRNEKWKNLVGKNFLDIFSKDDIYENLKKNKNEILAIFHLGACSDTTCTDEEYLLNNNFRFTKKLCEFALENNIRFIYASSAATYGDGTSGFKDDIENIENLRPINMYAYSKQLFDLWAKSNNILDKIAGLKYFNVFGPNEYHKNDMASMIYKMKNIVQKDKKVFLFKSNDLKNFKDGEQKRDFIYVKDAVQMTYLFLENPNVNGLFNIGSGTASSWIDLASSLFNALNVQKNIEFIDMPKNLLSQYQNYTCADMTKFFSFFKNFKITNINDSVNDYVKNYLIEDKRW